MLDSYEINSCTLAIIPLTTKTSQVIEVGEDFLVNKNSYEIIDHSCKYFGSSYIGRREGTKSLLGLNYKMPIIIEDSKNLIFFPTSSPRLQLTTWINLHAVNNYCKQDKTSKIKFINGQNLELDISFGSLDNQILRATRLESILRQRKGI